MRTISLTLLPLLGLGLATADARAQTWPTKPLRAIVPVAAGSSTDVIPRMVLEQLWPQLGQPIIVENRTGAGGTIGAAFVAKSEPDGMATLFSSMDRRTQSRRHFIQDRVEDGVMNQVR
jgi:tripartite-type tricarboxylate transporter receptor subunit TctC